jgi:protein-S-isoprenylcysteine O-methyltransferase Ste14
MAGSGALLHFRVLEHYTGFGQCIGEQSMPTLFLVPLLFGFNLTSAFTTAFSRRWGARTGQWASAILRNVLGIPLWVLGLVLVVREPAAFVFQPAPVVTLLGELGFGAGLIPIALGALALGRRAAAPAIGDGLERRGLYGCVRHPIYAGMLLEFVGLALLRPTRPVLVACAFGLVWVTIQVRLEELDVLTRVPAYRTYMHHVPRFVPRLS